jgi:hypothetical protein
MTAQTDIDDAPVARSHAATDKLPFHNPWLTIAPDEQTMPQRSMSEDPEQPTCAALIRMVSSVFEQQSRQAQHVSRRPQR